MAMDSGTIVVAGDGSVTGTGLALDMFVDALQAIDAPTKAKIAAAIGPFFEGLAGAIVNHIQAHATVTVFIHNTDGGLQTSTTAGAATNPPAIDKSIQGRVA